MRDPALLLFVAGFLAAIGFGLTVYAGYQHVQILRYLRAERRRRLISELAIR